MNILYSCGSKSWGGLEIQTLNLAVSFSERGHNVMLIAPRNSTLSKEAKNKNINVVEIYWGNSNIFKNFFFLKKIIKSFNPQIIHTQLSHDLWLLSLVKPKKSKLILTKRMASSVIKKDIFHKYIYSNVDLILCVSNFIKTNILNTVSISKDKVAIFHNGLNINKFNPEDYSVKQSKSKFEISEDTMVIGFLGRFTYMKGHKEFFEAGDIILKEITNKKIKFLVAGGDSYGEEEFGEKMRNLGTEILCKENIIYTGSIQNTAEVLSAMDILVFPSHEESFGNVLCEAGAMEIPVIASGSGGVGDIVEDNKTGILFEAKNSKDLSEKLLYYINNKEIRIEHAKNARKHIIEKFEIKKQLDKLEKIYLNLC